MKEELTFITTILLTVILLLLPGGCVSDFKAELPFQEEDILVVTGDIVENTEIDFVLSKGFSVNSTNPPPESRNVIATVTIVGSDGYQSQPAESMGDGVYRLAVGELKDDVAYGLRIEHQGNVYTSEPSTPLRTPEIDSLSWVQPEKYGDVALRVSTHEEATTEPQYYMWNYQEDWEFPARYNTKLYVNAAARKIDTLHYNYNYYCWKKNTINKLLVGSTIMLTENRVVNNSLVAHPSKDDRFSLLYCITVTQKTISKEAYEYYSAKKTENEEMGGIFTPQPNEVKGNIVCQTSPEKRTIGYITVLKNIARKRMFIDCEEISRERQTGCPLFGETEIGKLMADGGYFDLISFLLTEHYEPVGSWDYIDDKLDILLLGYASERCVNCVKAGGTKNKPDFWPNDHK